MLRHTRYHVVISDLQRAGVSDEGLRMLSEMQRYRYDQPVIFYVADLDESRGTPAYALGITRRPDSLLHYVMDALERVRG